MAGLVDGVDTPYLPRRGPSISGWRRTAALAAAIALVSAVCLVVLARPSGAVGEACSDGVDNDGDQKIDFPADPGCASPTDQSEGPTCTPVSGVVVCLAPGSLFQRFEAIAATSAPPTTHHVAGWVDQYRFTVAGVTTTLSCVGLAVDGAGGNPCALAGGTFVTRVLTLLDHTVSWQGIQVTPIVIVDVCNAELTVTAANNGIDSAAAYAPCEPAVDPGGLIPGGGAQGDCGTGGDAGNSHANASSISTPKSNCSGSLAAWTDPEDWYQFSATSGETISASMTPNASSDFDVCLYDPSGNAVDCSTGGTGATDSVSYTASVSGNWRLRIYIYAGSGSYTMSVSTSVGALGSGIGVPAPCLPTQTCAREQLRMSLIEATK